MTERPLLFSAPMVRATLDDSKTMTRRVVKKQFSADATPAEVSATTSEGWQTVGHSGLWWDDGGACFEDAIRCPYGQPGDRLWVRETWCGEVDATTSQLIYNEDGNTYKCLYRADGEHVVLDDGDGFTKTRKDGSEASPWKPSIHMPRWASRITLEIVSVRVERLQDISEADALAEGIVKLRDDGYGLPDGSHYHAADPRQSYFSLWEAINGSASVDSNPWVWVVEFRRVAPC